MYYKELTSGRQLLSIGEAPDGVSLPPYFIQINKSEYESLKKVLTIEAGLPNLEPTPLNEKGELIYASVQN